MTTTAATTFTPPRLSIVRKILGILIALLIVAVLVAYTLGQVFSDRVFYRSHFGNPVTGFLLAMVLSVIALFVLKPVRSEAAQHGRIVARIVLIALVAVSLVVLGFVKVLGYFKYDPTIVAHSPDGRWQAALVDVGDSNREALHLIRGTGLDARDVSDLGAPCGLNVIVTFTATGRLTVATNYGDFVLSFDQVTGQPENRIGSSCYPPR